MSAGGMVQTGGWLLSSTRQARRVSVMTVPFYMMRMCRSVRSNRGGRGSSQTDSRPGVKRVGCLVMMLPLALC